jgi:hypothetical protein
MAEHIRVLSLSRNVEVVFGSFQRVGRKKGSDVGVERRDRANRRVDRAREVILELVKEISEEKNRKDGDRQKRPSNHSHIEETHSRGHAGEIKRRF